MGFDPATGPTLKTALCHIRTLMGRMINNGGLTTLSGAALRAGSNPTSSGCICLSHHIVMHRRFF